jgi:polysaccharide biosynthesis protein PelC
MGVSEKANRGRRRLLLGVGSALIAVTLSGCGVQTGVKSLFGMGNADFASPEARSAQGASIAVLPFENLTTHQNAGTILADLMTTELYRLGALKVMESSRTRSLLAGAFGDADGRGETAYAQEVGRKLGVQTVMMGSVSEYGYQYGLREEPVVGVNIRVVRVADGAVIWATSESDIGSSFWSRESVNEVAQRVAGRTAERLGKAIAAPAPQPTQPRPQ